MDSAKLNSCSNASSTSKWQPSPTKNFSSYTFEIVGEKIPNSYAGSLNRIKGATGLKIPLAPRLISQRHPLPSLLFQLVNVKPFFLGGFAYTRTLAHNKVD